MDSLQSYLSSLVMPEPLASALPSLLLGAAGLAVLLGITWPRRALAKRARSIMFVGLAVAGCGLLAATMAPLAPGASTGISLGWGQATPATGVVALLCMGAGAERLSLAPSRDRRRARTLEAGALVLVAVGVSAVLLATSAGGGAIWASATQLPAATLAPIGWCGALAGAAGVVAANASGHLDARAAHARRGLVWGAFIFAAVLGVGTLAQGSGIGAITGQEMSLALLLAGSAALGYLAWSARRALTRPASAGGPRPRRTRRVAPHPARLAPSLPSARPSEAAGITPPSLLGYAAVASGQPFTPPALRRSLVVPAAAVPPAALMDPPPLPRAAAAPDDADQPNTAASVSLVPQSLLSPQFVTAVLDLQTEMLRAGREYSFEELVNVFAAIGPRAHEARTLWTNLAPPLPAGASEIALPPPASVAGDDSWPERPPVTMPRIRPTIVP